MSRARQEDGIEAFAEELASSADRHAEALGAGSETKGAAARSAPDLAAVLKIPVSLKVVLGSTSMSVAALGRLVPGTLLPLDRELGEPVDLVVNGQVVARGEVVVTDEAVARFAVTIVEVGSGG